MQQREDEAARGLRASRPGEAVVKLLGVAASAWERRRGRGVDGRRDREQSRSNSPSSAALQAPALPYTCGPYLGHATATLLLLLAVGGVEEPAGQVRARATRVQADAVA
jgi:hypothetical protein